MEHSPDRIYINLSSSVSDTRVTTSTDPDATFLEIRPDTIVADMSKYRLAVVRADLQGCRNFPILLASIQTGQTDPMKTTYTVSLQVTAAEIPGVPQPAVPFPYTRQYLQIKSFDALNIQQSNIVVSVYTTVPISVAAVAASLQAQMNVFGAELPLMGAMLVTASGNYLEFATTDPDPAIDGWSYTIQPYSNQDTNMYAFGFASNDPIESSSNGTRAITLPYPCSYSLPLVATLPSNNGVFTGTATMQWKSQVSGIYPPASPLLTVDTSNEQYWLYDYSWFAYLLNATLRSAFASIVSQATVAGVQLSLDCPTVQYVPGRSSFYFRTSFGTTPTTANGGDQLSVTLNKSLSNLMVWPGTYLSDGTETLLFDSAVRTSDGAYLDLLPDYPATGSGWSPVGSLVFMCSRWMIRNEVMSAPLPVGNSSRGNPTNDTQQILTDVIPAFSDAADWNAYPVLYAPQVLRWIDVPAGSAPLREIDFQCAWRNAITGEIKLVKLNPGASFSVKILLQRKDVFG